MSGSGKSTLVNDILASVLANKLNGARQVPGRHTRVTGLDQVDKLVRVDQSPIGRTPRSNPATYTGVFDKIRTLFAATTEAEVRAYQPGRFSFNVKGGRCDACSGDGTGGGTMVAQGTSEDVVANPDSYIGQFLADWLGLPAHNGARRDEAPARRRRKVSA